MNTKPIATDESYRILDNQFWYNDCSFIDLIKNKEYIVVNIDDLGVRELRHSEDGNDSRTTLSYKFSNKDDRDWWIENRGKKVTIELLSVN